MILWLNATPRVREGVRVGTSQRDRTTTPNTLTEERDGGEWRGSRRFKKKNRRRSAVHDTSCWDHLYFHNYHIQFLFWIKRKWGKGESVCVWAGDRGIRTSREVFLLLFLEFVNMFVLHGKSHCWSKLNAEFSLFYSFPFHHPACFFFLFVCRKRKAPEQLPHSNWYGSYLWVVQFNLSDRRHLYSLRHHGCISIWATVV